MTREMFIQGKSKQTNNTTFTITISLLCIALEVSVHNATNYFSYPFTLSLIVEVDIIQIFIKQNQKLY